MPELPPLYPDMTVREYLAFAAEIKGVARAACYWALWFALSALAGKLLLFPAMAWGQSDWLFALPRSLIRLIFETQPAELLLLCGSGCAWYLGGRAVSRQTTHETLLGQFQFFRMHMLGKLLQLSKDAIGSEYQRMIDAAGTDQAKINEAMQMRMEARKELAYMLGMSFALAGAGGTPVAMVMSNSVTNALWAAIAAMFGDDDDPWDPKRDFELAVRESLGDTAGNVVLKGLPSLVGMDISRRIGMGGMGDIIQGEPPAGATSTAKAQWYAGRLLGPSWGMVSDSIRGFDALAEGNIGEAIKFSSPKMVRDFIKTAETYGEGVKSGGKTILKPEDVSAGSLALMLVGINPAEVSLAREESTYLKNISTTLSQRRSSLIRRMSEAVVKGDFEAQSELRSEIAAWGRKQPKLHISQNELARGVKRMRDAEAGTLTRREQLIKEEYGS
jgi:hypothetical protein